MKRFFLVIPINDEAEAKRAHTILLEKGFKKPFLINDIQEILNSGLYVLQESGDEYARMENSGHPISDPEFWDQIPEPAKTKLINYLYGLCIKHEIPVDNSILLHHFLKQQPPPPPGFMKDVITISDDFDAPLEDFKEYEQ